VGQISYAGKSCIVLSLIILPCENITPAAERVKVLAVLPLMPLANLIRKNRLRKAINLPSLTCLGFPFSLVGWTGAVPSLLPGSVWCMRSGSRSCSCLDLEADPGRLLQTVLILVTL